MRANRGKTKQNMGRKEEDYNRDLTEVFSNRNRDLLLMTEPGCETIKTLGE